MNKLLSFSVVWLLLAAGSAVGQDVRYNFDKNTDFSKFGTYKWVTIKDAAPVNDITDKQIMAAVDAELATKGLMKVGDDTANLYIGYQAAVGQEKQFTSYSSDWGYGGGWYRGGGDGGVGGKSATTRENTAIYVGQLAGGKYKSANKNPLWGGGGNQEVSPQSHNR